MMSQPTLQVGDYIRRFSLPATTGKNVSTDDFVGRPLVVFFFSTPQSDQCAAEILAFRDLHAKFNELGVRVVGIGSAPLEAHQSFANQHALPFPLLGDAGATVASAFGAAQEHTTTFFFEPSFRVAKVYANVESTRHAKQALADAQALLTREPPRQIFTHAPVLLIPNVVPRDLCDRLIEAWHTHNEDSGFMKQIDGKTVGMTDYNHKIRRDHFLAAGPLEEEVKRYVTNRLLPQIRMAFNYPVTRREDFRIACYDSSRGGYFRPHRDNTTDGTAHRRFAMSLLLNDDYEGGYLRFPEFGQHLYRPDAGAAVVFSCSLLHEATDVTAGRRFVMLSFFYGEQEARIREEYSRRTGGGYRA